MNKAPLTPLDIEALGRPGACTVVNAVKSFGIRLLNEGFSDSSIRCRFPRLAPMVGSRGGRLRLNILFPGFF